MRDPTSQIGKYLGGLDGLRGVACLAVMDAHCIVHFAPTSTPNGIAQILAQGLTVFFALSGMLIYTPFVRDIARGERRLRVGHYVRRRLLRVFPVYLLIFVVCDFVFRAVYLTNAVDSSVPATDAGTGMMTDPVSLLLNLTLLQTFLPEHVHTGINPSWSLTTELTFYALLPAPRGMAGRPLEPPSRARPAPARGAGRRGPCGTLVGRAPLRAGFGDDRLRGRVRLPRHRRPVPQPAGDRRHVRPGHARRRSLRLDRTGELAWWTRRRATAIGWTLVVLGSIAALLMRETHPWFMGTCTSIGAAAVILLMVDPSARNQASRLVRVGSWRPIEYVGEISLSVYLWHYPIIILASRTGWFVDDSLSSLLGSATVVTISSIALGAITFSWIERPAMTGRLPLRSRARG